MNTTYTLSRNAYPLPGKKKMSFSALRNLLEPILYSKKTKEGLILTSEHMMLQQAMGYVIFGKTKKRALAIEEAMDELIQ